MKEGDSIIKEMWNEVERIREAWGVKAFDKVCDLLFKMQMRIEDLKVSRDKWKEKYEKLREEVKRK